MNYDEAFSKVINLEGGYSDNPNDPGGKTRYGITESVARNYGYAGDMKSFPLALAKDIYKKDYWDKVKADSLPEGLRMAVFDAAVNSGVRQSIKWLQKGVDVKVDGIIGPKTLEAIKKSPVATVLMRILALRLSFMVSLYSWSVFSVGWTKRICKLMEE